jgi:hypothetical protein
MQLCVVAAHGGRLRHWIDVPGNGVALCGFAPKCSRRSTSRGWISRALAIGPTECRQLRLCGNCAERRGRQR